VPATTFWVIASVDRQRKAVRKRSIGLLLGM
jgi:hypothetical protein